MIARQIEENMVKGSMIRQMFEEGNRLKALYGADQVFDFSLGNPDLEPPQAVQDALRDLVFEAPPGLHAYMSNAGHDSVRQAVAKRHSLLCGFEIPFQLVCMTVGAAGALNVALKAILDPGDEVILLAPFFFEYLSYIDNHGGKPVIVKNDQKTLLPDLSAIEQALSPRTKAIIINSPNNPSGTLYPETILQSLDHLLAKQKQTIYVLSDEPYAELVYGGRKMPPTFASLKNAVICTSWSKSLSLPGERIGCLIASPRCEDADKLIEACIYCNRILGFVNAPALFQRVIERAIHAQIDLEQYEKRCRLLADVLRQAGFDVSLPDGGLYLFPKSPIRDDLSFSRVCTEHNILVVPGSGFCFEGYFRLCFAVPEQTIRRSSDAFQAIGRHYGLI